MITIFDYTLRFIWAIVTVGIIGLIIYFRKSLTSIFHALGDIDFLKAGPLEFKRREQANKLLAVAESETETTSKFDSISEQLGINLKNKKMLLAMSSVALGISIETGYLDSDGNKKLKDICKKLYDEIKSIEPKSEFITMIDEAPNLIDFK